MKDTFFERHEYHISSYKGSINRNISAGFAYTMFNAVIVLSWVLYCCGELLTTNKLFNIFSFMQVLLLISSIATYYISCLINYYNRTNELSFKNFINLFFKALSFGLEDSFCNFHLGTIKALKLDSKPKMLITKINKPILKKQKLQIKGND